MNDKPHSEGGVGHCGLGGSPAAARLKSETAEHDRAAVLRVITEAGERGITGDRVAAALGWLPFRVRPRTSDLRKAGAIFDSLRRERNVNGIGCIVWIGRDHAGPVRSVRDEGGHERFEVAA